MRAILFLIPILFACAKPAGGPLSHTFDNTKIAAVPLDQKSAVLQAQQAHDLALLHEKTTKQSYRDSEIEEDAAELQAERAIVVSQVVASRQPDAKPTTNTETAALARKTADAKVAFMHARRDWLAKAADAALYAVYAAQAKLEFERAKVAQANHVAAADFTIDPFQKQLDARDAAAKTAADAAETERKTAEGKLAAWAEIEKGYLAASGLKGPLESARFAGEWKPAPAPPPGPAPEPPPEASAPPPATTPASP